MKPEFISRMFQELEQEKQRSVPPEDFPALPVIPAGRYTDPSFFALEKEFLWEKSWLYVCHADQLGEQGDYILWERTGSPIIVVRGRDGEIRAFYNTCRHRGGPLVKDASGHLDAGFKCSFHGWGYDLEGNLKAVRDQEDFPGLDMDCISLIKVRCETLGKWVFINEDSAAVSLIESLGPIAGQMEQFDLDNIRHVHSNSYEVECSFKIMMEAFLEVYHLHSVHLKTADRFLDYKGSRNVLWRDGHSLMVTPNRNPDWIDPGTSGMMEFPRVTELPVKTNVSYNIYPNLVTPVAATGIPFLTFWPMGQRRMRVDCHWFSPDWGDGERHPLWDQRIENFERILQEDLEFAPRLQKSIETNGFTGSRLSYQERRIYHWHEELDRRIGIDRIPEHLRIESKLAGMIELTST
jgi:choline monooxygenase